MQSFLNGITVTCFVGSYLVAMLLDLTRSVVTIPGRGLATIAATLAGLFAHGTYLVVRAVGQAPQGPMDADSLAAGTVSAGSADGVQAGLLASWYDWSLLVAWGIAACFLFLYLRRPDTSVAVFLLPVVLALVGLSRLTLHWEPFSRAEAAGYWSLVHAFAMLIGTAAVLMGFLAGVMYLTQARRLKSKQLGAIRLKLPTLEWLQRLNRQCLIASTVAVLVGLLAGVVMNLNQWGSVAWTSGGIVLSLVLTLWLMAATTVEFFYRPVRQGRKIAYLTLASFGFLLLALYGVLSSNHGSEPLPATPPAASLPPAVLPASLLAQDRLLNVNVVPFLAIESGDRS